MNFNFFVNLLDPLKINENLDETLDSELDYEVIDNYNVIEFDKINN